MQVSSKTSMSNAIFHNLESRSDELQSGFSENQLKLIEKADTQPYLAKCRIQNLVVYNTLPESFACLFDPQRTFGNPFRAVFSKIQPRSQGLFPGLDLGTRLLKKSRFLLVQRNFPLYTRGLLGCLLGFWSSGPNPAGAINNISIYTVSDLGVLSNLIGSLSLANKHSCIHPPTE